ncbi:hypothetical protein SAMN05192561_1254 [Halopenitus malekzadehii]|uniref:Uncharacterized protein n=1 Tax=Halopenitus malekzadehii TaxID=1267564 RepID=A0A1H6JV70_9EURY|nr:hypothetical protein [Halopenitus malekzadehii]SEH66545.1 hypothetical protein SAMN05192561_1254 [Halopenitus malekzadehii]
MEETTAAFILKRAPGWKSAEYHQLSMKRTLNRFQEKDYDAYVVANTESEFGMAVGYHLYPEGLGQYGYDTDFKITPDVEPQALENVDDVDEPEEFCRRFFEVWKDELVNVITADQEASLFSTKEYAAYIGRYNPRVREKEAADALGISLGNYRGKVGRAKEKIEKARKTLDLDDTVGGIDSVDEWVGDSWSAPTSVIDRVNEDRLPVRARWGTERKPAHERSVEQLILDEVDDVG